MPNPPTGNTALRTGDVIAASGCERLDAASAPHVRWGAATLGVDQPALDVLRRLLDNARRSVRRDISIDDLARGLVALVRESQLAVGGTATALDAVRRIALLIVGDGAGVDPLRGNWRLLAHGGAEP